MNKLLSNLKHLVIPGFFFVIPHLMRNLLQSNKVLTPARFLFKWIPACAGMTMLFLFLFTPSSALAAAVSWDGGASGSWNTAANWSNDSIPTSSDDVTIDNAAVTTSSNISFSTLTIGSGTYTTSLTLTNNITSGGSITINNAGTLTQNNKVQQVLTGTLTINSGGNLTHQANTTTTLPLQVKLFYTTCK